MKNKKIIFIVVVAIVFLAVIFWAGLQMLQKNGQDSVEKNKIVNCAINLYNQKKHEGMVFSSQCLGSCMGYAVDIVHVPRTAEDNLPENQCRDFIEGKLEHFIEMDKDGNIVRIV